MAAMAATKRRSVAELTMGMIKETVIERLELKTISSTCKAFSIADMGCSIGPSTFYYIENIVEAVGSKFVSQGFTDEEIPQFQVFFNDIPINDFNTLFKFLPSNRKYFCAGVPGSFHGQLFPNSSLHFVHCSYALHWLSEVPQEVVDGNSPAWNKGRVHYTSAPELVVNAFKAQFAKDMDMFLNARAKELVEGGLMVLIMPSIPDGISHSQVPLGIFLNHLGSCFMDMAKEGLVSEHLVDSFNVPMYSVTPKEMTELLEQNGCFSIERMEPADCTCDPENTPTGYSIMMLFRAGLEGFLTMHFGAEIVNKLFERFLVNMDVVRESIISSIGEGSQLNVIVKRKYKN